MIAAGLIAAMSLLSLISALPVRNRCDGMTKRLPRSC